MGILKRLGVPNADALEERVKSQMGAGALKQNPISGAAALGRLAKARGKLGKLDVPGELSVLLQPGKVRLGYEEGGDVAIRNRGKGFIAPKVPGFEVAPDGGGEPLPVHWYGRAEMPVKTGGVPPKNKCLL